MNLDLDMETSFDVFSSQSIYRLLLNSMARPGKICHLPPLGLEPPEGLSSYAASLALTLLDGETVFSVLPDNQAWRDYIRLNTGSRTADNLTLAQFIIMSGREDRPDIVEINRGSLLFPERGATVIFMVDSISDQGAAGLRVSLRGPGIPGIRELNLEGLHPANLERVIELNREYPLGVDVILCDQKGSLASIPRSGSISREVNN